MEYNGGSVIAMVGKDCVAIASDLRLGNQALGISSKFEKVISLLIYWALLTKVLQIFPMTDRVYIGLPGLATDVTTLLVDAHYLNSVTFVLTARMTDENSFATV